MDINYITIASQLFGSVDDRRFQSLFGVTPYVSKIVH